jgi:thymidine kinase
MVESKVINPAFYVFTGPMMGSKTTRLIALVDRFSHKGLKVLAFKPRLDNRYSQGEICTHNGGKIPAFNVSSGDAILEIVTAQDARPDVIAVDEAFMIDGSGEALISLYRSGFTVVVASIEMSSSCNVFPEIKDILPWATHVEKCSAVCTACGSDAYFTARKVAELEEIAIGGSELYEPRCWVHHSHVQDF